MPAKATSDELLKIAEEVKSTQLPEGLSESILARLEQLGRLTDSSLFLPELDRLARYVEWITSLPWSKKSQDVLDLSYAKQILDKNHYGLSQIKERILEYISVMSLKKNQSQRPEDLIRAPILFFVGLVGTGKTTIAKSIAESLGRQFARIPFGGMGSPLDLRGQSRLHPEAEPGAVIKALKRAGVKNPVILLDELDRVTDEGRSSIMGVLVELLDPEQNSAFLDHYLDFPFDLSEVLFIATANNTGSISTAVLDRLEPILMPSYTDEEKIKIGRDYVLPRVRTDAGLPEGSLVIEDSVWPKIVRPLGFDAGVRTLERNIEGIVRKIAKEIVEGKGREFKITEENVKNYLPQW